jgi:putative spermidine/putrescine transport system ATP-binding protein
LTGEVAERIVGRPGTFTVRPEKIRLADPSEAVAGDETSATGRIRDVIYLGSDTRYVVALDAGSELVVTAQNLTISSMEVLAAVGRSVRLIWKRQHNFPVAD